MNEEILEIMRAREPAERGPGEVINMTTNWLYAKEGESLEMHIIPVQEIIDYWLSGYTHKKITRHIYWYDPVKEAVMIQFTREKADNEAKEPS